MFDVITKKEFWAWIAARGGSQRSLARRALARLRRLVISPPPYDLKTVEDAYIMSELGQARGLRLLEAGGGNSRVLRRLARDNECWLADKFAGLGRGPTRPPHLPGVRIIQNYLGKFDPALPADYFDAVFSISVVEHVPLEELEAFFADCARLLKPGGRLLHAIDTYVYDAADRDNPGACAFRQRMEAYLSFADRPDLGIRLRQPPAIAADFPFSCRYASNPDPVMHAWHRVRPDEKREIAQVVAIKAEWVKKSP